MTGKKRKEFIDPKALKDLDIRQIAESGQAFRIREKSPGIWAVPAGSHYVEIVQREDRFLFSCEEEEFLSFWSGYWNLDLNYGTVKARVCQEDRYLTEACAYGWGIRILKQELWEMIVTFLISQNNNMVRIKRSVEALCDTYGEVRKGIGFHENGNGRIEVEYHAFPEPEVLAEAGIDGLAQMGLGYRVKYIFEMALWCSSKEGRQWLLKLGEVEYEKAHEMLMERLGVGKKVADCICLFGLHHIGAFPMDTHVKQIIARHYPEGFPMSRYEGCAGIMQQYMFYYKVKENM